jgi:D-glycero-D-manno-heptose 1,7-bisphosphate phosphatase
MNKAIFIDKDGTLVHDVPFNVDPELIEVEKYAFESLHTLQQHGFEVIVISNQPGVALGYFNEEKLKIVEEKIKKILSEKHIALNGFYYCPHSEKEDCDCRKPKPGLLLKAAHDLQIDLSKSWMIGDILNDVEAGRRSGCNTILIDNGNETEWIYSRERIPNYIANHLKEAAEIVLHYPVV